MEYIGHQVGECRLFDCVYDTSYFASDRKDLWRRACSAMDYSKRVHELTRFNLMFSSLPTNQRKIYFKNHSVFRQYSSQVAENFTQAHNNSRQFVDIRGRDRATFFYYMKPTAGTMMALCVTQKDWDNTDSVKDRIINPFRTVGCQTDYRESETQTIPYYPDGYLPKNTDPNDLDIFVAAKILKGCEDPTNFELQRIERGRKRRIWERCNDIIKSDNEQFKIQQRKHYKILEAFEWEEWLSREQQLSFDQNARFEVVKELIKERDENYFNSSFERIEKRCKVIELQRTKKYQDFKIEHDREMRKLEFKHRGCPRRYHHQKIADQYIDFSSDLYGPQIRFGTNPKHRHFVAFKQEFQDRLDDIVFKADTIESFKCPFAKLKNMSKPKSEAVEYVHDFLSDNSLKTLYDGLKYYRTTAKRSTEAPRCLLRKEVVDEELVHGKTLLLSEDDIRDEYVYQSALFLTKIIKGRAEQNLIYAGKKEFKGLIDEIGSTYLITELRSMFPLRDFSSKSATKYALCYRQHMERIRENCTDLENELKAYEGGTLGWLLDLLHKEKLRSEMHERLLQISQIAATERTRREASEAGKRQAENRLRAQHQNVYNNMIKADQDTMNIFLCDTFNNEMKIKSDHVATKCLEEYEKNELLEYDHRFEKRRKNLNISDVYKEDRLLITHIVKEFLFPHVRSVFLENENAKEQRKHLIAAHDSLYETNVLAQPNQNVLHPRKSSIQITSNLIDQLLDRVVSSEDSLPPVTLCDHPMKIVIDRFINKILRTCLPTQKYKSESERIADITVSQILRYTLPSDLDKRERLDSLLSKFNQQFSSILVLNEDMCPENTYRTSLTNFSSDDSRDLNEPICDRMSQSIESGYYPNDPTPPLSYDGQISQQYCSDLCISAHDILRQDHHQEDDDSSGEYSSERVFKNEYFLD